MNVALRGSRAEGRASRWTMARSRLARCSTSAQGTSHQMRALGPRTPKRILERLKCEQSLGRFLHVREATLEAKAMQQSRAGFGAAGL
jgi:hypothetical protein